MAKLHVLIIEDSELDSALLLRTLRQSGYELVDKRVETANDLQNALCERQWDCIISDFSMPGFSGISALKMVREKDSNVPFIFVSGTIGEDIAVDAMRTGAQDYVLKGNLARLLPAIDRELVDVKMRRDTNTRNRSFGNWKSSRLLDNWPVASPTISIT
jgi:DNA-binding NtrC family response regulator